jgi:serine phosphatase RsbU (regulator of sigma subunit)
VESNEATTVGGQLRRDGPARVAENMRRYLADQLGIRTARLLLVDYRMSGLSPVLPEGEHSTVSLADPGAAMRCFGSQQLLLDEAPSGVCHALAPVTLWGDRIGVLIVELPGPPDKAMFRELTRVADEVAANLVAAERFTDRYRQARRRRRLTMAAELQWDMLPGRGLAGPTFELAGQLEPAYEVCGDHFDWSVTDDRLVLSVLNGNGRGMEATLLTALAVNAMRNARRSGGSLVEQAELASDAVFATHGGKQHLSTLLLEFDIAGGRVQVIDAGSPRAIRVRGGQITPVELEHELPLGMFAETRYAGQEIDLQPGDRLFIVSDGVHAAVPAGQQSYGGRSLTAAIRATRLQPPPEAVTALMRSLDDYHQGEDLQDDAVIVCLELRPTPSTAPTL